MAIRDFTSQRLFVEMELAAGAGVPCDPQQSNYLINVLRLQAGDMLLVFNGRDGEWLARIGDAGKRSCTLLVEKQVREQHGGPDITFLFALLKRTKIETVVEKATELGVARMQPLTTDHTQVGRINEKRLRSSTIEAAEQCGILRLPELLALQRLDDALDAFAADRPLVFCDESAEVANPVRTLQSLEAGPVGVLVGPEGGFSERERQLIAGLANAVPISLGPRVMRADTAAVAALALVNATLGDWQ